MVSPVCAVSVGSCKIHKPKPCCANTMIISSSCVFGDAGRELRIMKMFATEHPVDWMPFEITHEGFQLKRKQ